ncbi:MAG: twin-arginine translocase TatA/TatE family subunit [Candidatus Obscuribacter phosphatis]|uniref:Sec-independent protein translocase protein TatA n=1 Tax=Candidatus Obscuribacter phosphatis TaxID=1906157 RepID=A0A8J7P7R9_9BACT|nr:twin-arginine translocase TatA/TatE family subunit [Candidatus Obscuribacter phosphatis]
MFSSPVDVAIVLGVALLVFGPKKLPELGKSLGQGLGNFKKALSDAQEDVTSIKDRDTTSKNTVKADDPAKALAQAGSAVKADEKTAEKAATIPAGSGASSASSNAGSDGET